MFKMLGTPTAESWPGWKDLKYSVNFQNKKYSGNKLNKQRKVTNYLISTIIMCIYLCMYVFILFQLVIFLYARRIRAPPRTTTHNPQICCDLNKTAHKDTNILNFGTITHT